MNLALNNLQRLICHKTQTTNQPTNQPKSLITIKDFSVEYKFSKAKINLVFCIQGQSKLIN